MCTMYRYTVVAAFLCSMLVFPSDSTPLLPLGTDSALSNSCQTLYIPHSTISSGNFALCAQDKDRNKSKYAIKVNLYVEATYDDYYNGDSYRKSKQSSVCLTFFKTLAASQCIVSVEFYPGSVDDETLGRLKTDLKDMNFSSVTFLNMSNNTISLNNATFLLERAPNLEKLQLNYATFLRTERIDRDSGLHVGYTKNSSKELNIFFDKIPKINTFLITNRNSKKKDSDASDVNKTEFRKKSDVLDILDVFLKDNTTLREQELDHNDHSDIQLKLIRGIPQQTNH